MLYHRALLGIWYYQLFYAHFPFMMYTYPMEDKSTNKSDLINRWFFFLFVDKGIYSEILAKYIDVSNEQFDLVSAIANLNALSKEKRDKAVEIGLFPGEVFKEDSKNLIATVQFVIPTLTKEGGYTRLFLEKLCDEKFRAGLEEEQFNMDILQQYDFDLVGDYLNLMKTKWTGDSWDLSFLTRKRVNGRTESVDNPFSAFKVYGQGEYSKLLIGWSNAEHRKTADKQLSPNEIIEKGFITCLNCCDKYSELSAKIEQINEEEFRLLRDNDAEINTKRKGKKRTTTELVNIDEKKYEALCNATGDLGLITETTLYCLQKYHDYIPYKLNSIISSEDGEKESFKNYIARECHFKLEGAEKKRKLQKTSYDLQLRDEYSEAEIQLVKRLCRYCLAEGRKEFSDFENKSVKDKIECLAKVGSWEEITSGLNSFSNADKDNWETVFNKYLHQNPKMYDETAKQPRDFRGQVSQNQPYSKNPNQPDVIENEELKGHNIANHLFANIINTFSDVVEEEFCNMFIAAIHHCLENTKFRLNCGDPDISSNHRGYMANSICDATRKKMDEKIAELIRKDNPKIVLPSRLNIKETKTLLQDFNEITDEDLEKRFNVPEVLIDYVKLLFLLETLRNTTKSGHSWEKFYGEYSKIVYNRAPGTRDEQMEKFINNMKEIYNDFKKTKGGLLCR